MLPEFGKGEACSLDLAMGKRAAFCLAKKACCLLFSKEGVLPFVWQRRRAVFGKEGVLPFVWQRRRAAFCSAKKACCNVFSKEGVLPFV